MLYQLTSKKRKTMKTKNLGFLEAFKSIVFNQRGNIDLGSGDSAPAAEAAPAEASSEVSSEESAEIAEPVEIDSESSNDENEIQANNEQELEAEIQEAVENGADEEQVKSMIRKYNLKIDGQEIEEEVDLDNEEEMIRTLQLAKKSHKTMQEKAELERATAKFLKDMRANPFQALKQLDPNFDEVSYVNEFIDNMIKENEMTPEEKEQARIRKEYEELVAERDRLKQEKEEQARAEQTQAILNQIKAEISKELQADEDLVLNDDNIALVAQEMIKAGEKNVELTPKQALDLAKKRLQQDYNRYANTFKSTASMKKYMGNELLERLKEDRIKAAQQQAQVKNAKTNPISQKPAEQSTPKKTLTLSDILAGRASGDSLED